MIVRFHAILTAVIASVYGAQAGAMEFKGRFDGAARIDLEALWISAEGIIQPSTPAEFEEFLTLNNIGLGYRIVLNSLGGDLLAGMQLGEIIRERGLRTAIGRTVSSPDNQVISTVEPGVCASACFFMLLGGTERLEKPGSRIGIHQFSLQVSDADAKGSISQALMGLIISFVIKMGVDPGIIPTMASTSAGDMYWIKSEEATEFKVLYQPYMFDDWSIEEYRGGIIMYSRTRDELNQVTVFCRGADLLFTLSLRSGQFGDYFLDVLRDVDGIDVLGWTVPRDEFDISRNGNEIIVTGKLKGSNDNIREAPYTFSLLYHTLGSNADAYSLYHFNRKNFEENLRLARKNCSGE